MSIHSSKFSCSKSYHNFPCSHRQWQHSGHCKFVHGYSRSFTFWFVAKNLDINGFVVDFSSLKPLEKKLKDQFDHTFLINKDDPLMTYWQELNELDALAKLALSVFCFGWLLVSSAPLRFFIAQLGMGSLSPLIANDGEVRI